VTVTSSRIERQAYIVRPAHAHRLVVDSCTAHESNLGVRRPGDVVGLRVEAQPASFSGG
jgi:hypothetical protein